MNSSKPSDSDSILVQEAVIATPPAEPGTKRQVIAPHSIAKSQVIAHKNLNIRVHIDLYNRFHTAKQHLRVESNADMLDRMLTLLERRLVRIPKVCPSMEWRKVDREWFPAFRYLGDVNYRSQGAVRDDSYGIIRQEKDIDFEDFDE
jgi:hypothetical protein